METNYTISNLSPSTQYFVQVQAVGTGGSGAWSNELSKFTTAETPSASLSPSPTTFSFDTNGTWHTFTLTSSEDIDIVVNPSGYGTRLEITSVANQSNFCSGEVDDAIEFANGDNVYLSGCDSGQAKVELRRASNNALTTNYTFNITESTPPVITPPGQVTGLSLTSTTSSVSATWNTATNATGYTIQWAESGQAFSTSRQTTTSIASKTISSLNPNTLYYVHVKATRTGASDGTWSSTLSARTQSVAVPLLCEPITGFTVSRLSIPTVRLTWDNPSAGLTSTGKRIEIEKFVNGAWLFERYITEPASSTLAYHLGLDNSWYTYRIENQCSTSNSAWTSWAYAAPYTPGSSARDPDEIIAKPTPGHLGQAPDKDLGDEEPPPPSQ